MAISSSQNENSVEIEDGFPLPWSESRRRLVANVGFSGWEHESDLPRHREIPVPAQWFLTYYVDEQRKSSSESSQFCG